MQKEKCFENAAVENCEKCGTFISVEASAETRVEMKCLGLEEFSRF